MRDTIKNILTGILAILLFLISVNTTSHLRKSKYIYPEIKSKEELILEKMTLERKIGQLFLFGFSGTNLNQDTIEQIENKHIGGVLVLGYNIQNTQQLQQLLLDIQSYADIPVFVAIDQEGGVVARLKDNQILTISQREMKDEKNAYDIAKQRGELLYSMGINMNLAPVIEYTTDKNAFMYERVFRGKSENVAKLGKASIQGYTDSNIVSVAKHYPGHGNTHSDSHNVLPKILISQSQWSEYIFPFKYVIEEGVVHSIMTGHILFPSIDSKPSTISPIIVTQKLREELGFEGVMVTDDMLMDSIEDQGEYCDIAKQALLAGNDILIYSGIRNVQNQVYDCILESVVNKEIDEEIVDEKVLRILRLKLKFEIINTTSLPQE